MPFIYGKGIAGIIMRDIILERRSEYRVSHTHSSQQFVRAKHEYIYLQIESQVESLQVLSVSRPRGELR